MIPFQTSEIAARRLLNLELRRTDPRLLRGTFTVHSGTNWIHWSFSAGDRVTMMLPTEGVTGPFIIEAVEGDLANGTITMTVREDPDAVYSDSFDLLPVGTLSGKVRTGIGIVRGGDDGISVRWVAVGQEPIQLEGQPEGFLLRVITVLGLSVTPGTTPVYRIGTTGWSEVAATARTMPGVQGPAIAAGLVEGEWNVKFLVFNASYEDANTVFVTFAARTGVGTDEIPYVYHDPKQATFPPPVAPWSLLNLLVEIAPDDTTPGVEGQMQWIVEQVEP